MFNFIFNSIKKNNYFVQFKAPWFHSWNSPIKRIKINNNLLIIHEKILHDLKIKGRGKIKAISTSKIKKIIAIKKNRIEKGIREDLKGSNPHSNGAAFSRSLIIFFDKIEAKSIMINEIIIVIKVKIVNK